MGKVSSKPMDDIAQIKGGQHSDLRCDDNTRCRSHAVPHGIVVLPFLPIDGTSSERLKLCCSAEPGPRTTGIKVWLHYAYKVRILVRCIRDCAVALLRFCGLPTPQKRNGLFTLAWHRTDFGGCLRVIIVRHFEKSDIQFSSLISQHYFRINGNLKKYANIEII